MKIRKKYTNDLQLLGILLNMKSTTRKNLRQLQRVRLRGSLDTAHATILIRDNANLNWKWSSKQWYALRISSFSQNINLRKIFTECKCHLSIWPYISNHLPLGKEPTPKNYHHNTVFLTKLDLNTPIQAHGSETII